MHTAPAVALLCEHPIIYILYIVERKSLCFGMLIKFFYVCSSAGVSNRVKRYVFMHSLQVVGVAELLYHTAAANKQIYVASTVLREGRGGE